MIISPTPEHGLSLILIEGCLTAIAVSAAFLWPRIGNRFFGRIERSFGRLSRKKGLSVAFVGTTALLIRLAILPRLPVPQPFIPDDFSFLLAADTFASGRLANPTPLMWKHFENINITMKPTYTSMYFPAQGLVMAGSKVLAGNPWYGILCSTALMCAAICWMLQAWLPPAWALFGGMLAVLHLGLFSYWVNTYTGAGSIAALGGALVLGAFPRLMKTTRIRDGVLIAVGLVLLATSRPYEGLLLALPVLIVLARWILFGVNRPPTGVLVRRAVLPLALIVAAGAWMGYYNYRAFGNPLIPPYKISRATYAVTPYFIGQTPTPEPVYRHKPMRDYYVGFEFAYFQRVHTMAGFLSSTLFKPLRVILFFAGIALLPPLIMLRRVFRDRRIRFLVICCVVLAVGMLGQIWLLFHYVAPFTAAFYAIGLQAMRHLRLWEPGGQSVGIGLVRLTITACIAMAVLRIYAAPLHIRLGDWPGDNWVFAWYGPSQFGTPRANVETQLERLSGRQLAIVRYSSNHSTLIEWVYNAADIDNSKVIWAWDMGARENRELIQYYKDRQVWLVQPDTNPAKVSPYFLPGPDAASTAASPKTISALNTTMQHGGMVR